MIPGLKDTACFGPDQRVFRKNMPSDLIQGPAPVLPRHQVYANCVTRKLSKQSLLVRPPVPLCRSIGYAKFINNPETTLSRR